MRTIEHNGNEYQVTERDWRRLLRRFDARKATVNTFGYYCIHVNSICVSRGYKCLKCPLGVTYRGPNRCTYLFYEIMGEDLAKHVYMFDHAVIWHPDYDTEARQALNKVKSMLAAATKATD